MKRLRWDTILVVKCSFRRPARVSPSCCQGRKEFSVSVGCARRQRSFEEDDSVPGLLFGAFPVLLNEVRPPAPLVSPENECTTEAGTRPETQEVGFSSEGEKEVGVDTDAI